MNKIIKRYLSNWEGIEETASRVTTGNLSHHVAGMKCNAKFMVNLTPKYLNDPKFGTDHSESDLEEINRNVAQFSHLITILDRITTGNMSHQIATVRGMAKRNSEYIKQYFS